ncbi:ribosome assembly protein 4, putative [Plasmodium malariae]|uniref:Ribosome assembly protein 4, putative n=1 Tax=Plasmodium malariae TaxID=5858 RepID=A0A1A8X5N2_PLAMA|nr:ribosome assembly protein 4, putative [Plasmodium malariae]SBT00563.1 ribosome assembly protein 4, putative (RSA4) [Plasmodium malariae]SCN12974.1 ribosome assembly protein 4, putative [Plasmodium malariae]
MEVDSNNNVLTKEILIQFVNHENKATGPVINVPLSITKDNLDELINDLKKKKDDFIKEDLEDINYSFMINDKLPIKNSLYDAIKDNNISSENVLSIKYFPLNIFKVKKINTCCSTLPGHTNSILCLAFSPNSLHLATGSGDNTIRLWDINTQTPIATLKDHTNWVLAVLFSPDNKFLATAGMDQNVCVYDTHTGKLLNILTGHKKEVTTLCFEPLHLLKEVNIKKNSNDSMKRKKSHGIYKQNKSDDNKKKKTKDQNENTSNSYENNVKNGPINGESPEQSSEKTEITCKEEKNGNNENSEKHNFASNKNDINEKRSASEFSNKRDSYFVNSRLASAGKDGIIRINNILSNMVEKTLTGHTDTITCILWSGINEKNSRIYSSSRDTTVKIWNVNEGSLIYNFIGHKHWVNCISLNSERILKNGIYNLDVVINKTHIENCIEKARIIYQNFLKNQTNEKFVSGSDDGTLYLIDCLNNDTYKSTRLIGHQKTVIHAQFSPNGKLIASSSFDKSIRIWSGLDGTFLAVYRGHVGPVYKIAWSIDNNYVVSCSQDSTLKLWKINHLFVHFKKKENVSHFKEEEQKEGGTLLNANGANDVNEKDKNLTKKKKDEKEQIEKNKKTVKILLVDLPGHSDAVYAIDWSNDGKFVASGGKDKILKIWTH